MAATAVSGDRARTSLSLRLYTALLTSILVSTVSGNAENYTVCDSEACRTLGENMNSQLFQRNNICKDFYSFVCGGWHLNNPILRGQLWRDQFVVAAERTEKILKDILETDDKPDDFPSLKAARKYHRACIDAETIEKTGTENMKKLINQVGEWPMTQPLKTYSSEKSWREIDVAFSEMRSASSFYSVQMLIHADHYVLELTTPRFIMPPEQFVLEGSAILKHHYRTMIAETIFRLTSESVTEFYKDAISTKVSQLVDFEVELAKIVLNNKLYNTKYFTTIGDFQKIYNGKLDLMVRGNTEYSGSCLLLLSRRLIPKKYDGVQLNKCGHEVNWLNEIRRIGSVQYPGLIHQHTPIVVSNIEYYVKLCRLLEKTPDEVIVNYIYWSFVRTLLPYADSYTKKIVTNASQKLPFILRENSVRWKQCLFENRMLGSIYYYALTKHFSDEVDEKSRDIFNAVDMEVKRRYLRPLITNGITMDLADEAFDNKKLRFKAPKFYMDFNRINKTLVEEDVPSTYLDQVLSHRRYRNRANVWKTFELVDPNRDMNPWLSEITSEIYEIHENKTVIDFPAGSMQLPFFDIDIPESYVFGALGSQLAQKSAEIVSLHIQRSYFKELGAVERTQINCFRNQKFGDYQNEDRNLRIRGSLESVQKMMKLKWSHKIQETLGLDVAFKAYRRRASVRGKENLRIPGLEEYNDEQLVFMGFANAFCESPITIQSTKYAPWYETRRYSNAAMVNMAIMNNPDFPQVFGCPKGTPMNPSTKCTYLRDPQK